MSDQTSAAPGRKFTFPTAYTILFALIVAAAIGSWIIPAGQYNRVENAELGRETPVPGTYHSVDANHQGLFDVVMAPIAGIYDPAKGTANAIDVVLFIIVIGGFMGVIGKTGAIELGIAVVMRRLKGREILMIPVLTALFAAGGTTFGMAEETLPLCALLVPVMYAAGYDSIVAVSITLLGTGIGTLGSTINPFATVIASNAAGVPFTDGMALRFAILAACWLATVGFVMAYAARIKRDPARSMVADKREEIEAHFPHGEHTDRLTFRQSANLGLFILTFVVMIWGVSSQGWWMGEMTALFFGASILMGVVGGFGEKGFVDAFIDGCRELLGVALIVGLARGIVVVMDAGLITDTILHTGENALSGLPSVVFINLMFGVEAVMSLFVPSTSGLAVLTMPILAPLGDFAGVERSTVITAYQSAIGLTTLLTPTSAVVMGSLAIGRVPYPRWVVFLLPLLFVLTLIIIAALSIAVMIG